MGTNTLGEIISHLRRKAGLTQEALADGICSPVSVSRIENGNQMPSGKVLEKLLERLGTGTYQLCNVYYENECQASLRRTLAEIEAQVSSGDFAQAREALQQLPAKKMDSANLQRAAMLRAAICMKDGTADENMEAELLDALRLTKPNIDLNDCRGGLFSPAEVNLLVMLTEAKYMAGKNLEAIRLGEEVMFALDRSKSRLSEYKVFQINLAHNLGQYLLKEKRYEKGRETQYPGNGAVYAAGNRIWHRTDFEQSGKIAGEPHTHGSVDPLYETYRKGSDGRSGAGISGYRRTPIKRGHRAMRKRPLRKPDFVCLKIFEELIISCKLKVYTERYGNAAFFPLSFTL